MCEQALVQAQVNNFPYYQNGRLLIRFSMTYDSLNHLVRTQKGEAAFNSNLALAQAAVKLGKLDTATNLLAKHLNIAQKRNLKDAIAQNYITQIEVLNQELNFDGQKLLKSVKPFNDTLERLFKLNPNFNLEAKFCETVALSLAIGKKDELAEKRIIRAGNIYLKQKNEAGLLNLLKNTLLEVYVVKKLAFTPAADELLLNSLKFFNEQNNFVGIAYTRIMLAHSYMRTHNMENFNSNQRTILRLITQYGSIEDQINTYLNLAHLYDDQRDIKKTTLYLEKASQLCEIKYKNYDFSKPIIHPSQIHDLKENSQIYAALGLGYYAQNQPDSSHLAYLDALKFALPTKDRIYINEIYFQLASVSVKRKEAKQALKHIELFQVALIENPSDVFLHNYHIIKARAYFLNKIYDKVQVQLDSIRRFENILTTDHLSNRKEATALQSEFAASQGNYELAYDLLNKAFQLDDSLGQQIQANSALRSFMQFDNEQKNKEIELLNKEKELRDSELKRQQYFIIFAIILIILVLGVVGLLLYQFRIKNKANKELNEAYQQISTQNQEIVTAYMQLNAAHNISNQQKIEIAQRQAKIEDSINYALRIQEAILPDSIIFKKYLNDFFIFYRPKDIVSGDFYWAESVGNSLFIAVIDCTGHGVPGGFMSMLGNNLFHTAVVEDHILEPAKILEEVDRKVRATLKQDISKQHNDGMDVCLIKIPQNTKEQIVQIEYAGAGRPMYIFHKKQASTITELKPSKYPVGGAQHEHKIFDSHIIEVQKGDRLYMFSDGVTDQFGGTERRKFSPKRLQNFIVEHEQTPVHKQKEIFQSVFDKWQVGHKQLDDITLLAIEI